MQNRQKLDPSNLVVIYFSPRPLVRYGSLPIICGLFWPKGILKGRIAVQPSLLDFFLQKNVTNLHTIKICNFSKI